MFKKNEPTRLGEVLLNKGLISSEQLAHAIKEQASRRKGIDSQDPTALQATSLGEILIALGHIDRLELQRGLNWQANLRKMTIAMALCAPFMSLSTGAAAAVTKVISGVPAVVQAEEYTTMSGVALETTYDTGGGQNVKSIEAGDYLNFSGTNVDLPTTGTYVISYRVSSVDGGSITFNNEGSSTTKIDTITVPKTGSAQTWVTVQRTVSLKYGAHYFSVKGVSGSVNLNWIKIETAGTTTSSSSASSTPPTSNSTPATTLSPVTIQAENYSAMSGVYNEATTDVGGGQDTGNINTGDWMTYANTTVAIPVTGVYKVTYRVASLSAGGTLNLTEASTGAVLNTVSVLVTGAWQKWVDVTSTVKLTAGNHTFGIKASAGGFNVNWFRIEGTALSSSSSSTSSSVKSSTSSSSSSKPAVSSSSLSSSSKATSSATSSTSSSGVVSTVVAGPVGMNWIAPAARLDGTVLDISEIGGYEIRYKLTTEANFTYISINDAYTTQYNFPWMEGNYVFQVAAFDKNGVYSNFVDVVSAN